ncbi:MAG: FG-GAP-like repeat-containing protein [Planctomycetota bacterium]
MSPQFVDFNADGHDDIVCGIFDGSPHVSYWDAEAGGFLQPVGILDKQGQRIVLNAWWNFDAKQWQDTDRCDPEGGAPAEGHLTSAIAFDYDRDGDWDLVLGDHKGGYVYLRRNEGSNAAPKFATRNELVMAAGKPMHDPGTVATIRAVDWNGDGKLDLMVSGMGDPYGEGTGGGVAVYLDESTSGDKSFGAAVTLIEPSPKGSVGEPRRPDAGLHPEPVDLDGDGDLDLIVGGYSMWKPNARELSDAEKARAEELQQKLSELRAESSKLYEQASKAREGLTGEAAQQAFAKAYEQIRPQMAKVTSQLQPLQKELDKLQPRPQRVSFTWFYENLAKTGTR